jgi:hypothetical protein
MKGGIRRNPWTEGFGRAQSGRSDDSGRETWNGNDHEAAAVHDFGRPLRTEEVPVPEPGLIRVIGW